MSHAPGVCNGAGRLSPSPPGQVETLLQPMHLNCCRQPQGHLLGLADRPECTRELAGGAGFTSLQSRGPADPALRLLPLPSPKDSPAHPMVPQLPGKALKSEALTQGSQHPPVSMTGAPTRAEVVLPSLLTAFSPPEPSSFAPVLQPQGPNWGERSGP